MSVALELERRSLTGQVELRSDGDNDAGGFAGYANLSEVRDEYGSVMKRGAYKKLDELVRDGFIAVGHDWGTLGVAYITSAREDERGLYIEARFHGDEESQKIRRRVQERMDAGKSVSLSIGFFVNEWTMEEVDGQETRMVHSLEVKEVSIVTVPGTPGSQMTDVRQGMTYADEFAQVLGAAANLVKRTGEIVELRGSNLSEERKAQIVNLADEFERMASETRAMVPVEVAPDEVLADLAKAFEAITKD